MIKYLLSALFALLLVIPSHAIPPKKAPAPPKGGGNFKQPHNHHAHGKAHYNKNVVNYHTKFGHRFKFGYYYTGFNHNQWSYQYWDKRYGAFLYYDPYTLAYYYWCGPHFRYYPVTYAPLGYAFPYVETPVEPDTPPPAPPPVGP